MNIKQSFKYFSISQHIAIGTKFYKWNDNIKSIIRLIGFLPKTVNHPDRYVFLTDDGKKITYEKDKFLDQSGYTILYPDGELNIVIIKDKESKKNLDLIITVRSMEEYPIFACCRQNYPNMKKLIEDPHPIKPLMGYSTNTDEFNEHVVNMCKITPDIELYNPNVINVYMDDKVNDIASIILDPEYNLALKEIKRRMDNPTKDYPCGTVGCVDNIKELLKTTGFMRDFYKVFNIYYSKDYIVSVSDNLVSMNIIDFIKYHKLPSEDYNIRGIYCAKYDKSIDMSTIERDHILVANDKAVYIVGYDIEE